MSLLNKYVQKYGNYDQVKRLQKPKDWMPQTPSSAEKESNVAAAHKYMDSLSDDDRKRILSDSPLGKSAGMIATDNGFLGAKRQDNEYNTYKAAESILQNEAYEKRREDVVRKNGSYAYKTMKNYIDLIDQSRESRQGGGNLGGLINAGKTNDLKKQAAEIKKALNQMGISGKDFDKYEQYVREYRDIESTQTMEKDIANKLAEKPISRGIGYTAADVLVSPITGLMATAESLKRPFYADPSAPVNTYSDLYRLQNASEAVEQNITDKIDNKFGKFFYGAGVSTLKSAEAMAIGGALSGALGIDAASKLGQLTTLPMFGASAFASTLSEAQKKGFSAEMATQKALASGIAEMLFEELSLDKAWGTIKNAKSGVGGLRKRILDVFMGAGIEGSEEVFTDLANHIADNFINGDFSDYQSGIRMRVESGMSLDQATREAKKEFVGQLVESGLAGALSGFAMNVGGATYGHVEHKKTAKNINANTELKSEVLDSAKGLKGTTAAEIANSKSAEEITENDMAEIIYSMEEVSGKSAHDIAKESLVKLGESEEEAEKKASEIVEAVNQVEPTEEQEAKNTKLVEDEKVAEAYTDVLKNRVAQNALYDVAENNKKVKQKRSGGVTALSNGNKIKVYDFEDVNKGIVNTSVGTMSLDSVQMAENERRLFKTAYVFENNNASNAYVNGYKGQNISDYSNAAMRAYTVGASGASFESFINDPRNASIIASVDNNAFLQEMYFHGQNMIKTEEVAKVDKSAKEESKATTQSDLQNVFNEVAKVFNLNISETATGEESGSFIPSSLKLTLNQNESKNLYQTLHHELMEYSKAYAPKEYNELKSAIMDFATQKLGSSKIKMHLEIYRDTYRGFGARSGNESEAKKTLADATDEYVNDFVAQVMSSDEGVNQFVGYLADNSDLTEQQKTGIIQSLKDFIQKLIDSIKAFISKHTGMNLGAADAKALTEYADDLAKIRDKIQSAWDASRATVEEQLNSVGFEADTVTNTVASNSVRTTIAESWKELGYKSYDEAIHEMAKNITDQMVAKTESKKVYDEFYEKALKWVIAEESVANFILGSEENQEYLDYVADDRYKAIKDNSDYDQGTFDLSNLCRKREIFTKMFDNLQKEYPDHLFTAAEIATVREVLRKSHMEVACALCYVEDRRQHMGEAANEFVEQYKIALKNPSKVIMYKNSKGELKPLKVTEEQSKQYGYKQGSTYKAEDKYVPTQYDLVTYQGFKDLEINHPEVAHAFVRYNNARGQNSARLVEGHAEYKREVLDYTADRVKKINDLGGLRIFSFSDLEGIHVIDLMQVITDSATQGLMIQFYTKVPAYAAIVKDTGIKLNRSLIPATRKSEKAYAFINGKWENVTGKVKEEGIATVDGKEYIAVDIIEGINVTDKYFYNDDNPNIGNILIGITDKQIALAMLDPNIDYIIPFHTGQADDILQAKGIVGWDNYKDYQTEKKLPGHIKKAKDLESWDKEAINIYTDVINKYNVKNKDEFVKYFLKECKDNHLKPRFEQFAYNEDGSIREGYYKFLLDYKLFDRDGNILKQQPVLPTFDEQTLKLVNEFLTEDKERSKNLKFSEDITNTIKKELGLDKKVKKAHSLNVDSEGKTLTKDQAKYFENSKVRNENGNLLVLYHGSTEPGFTVFKEDAPIYLAANRYVARSFAWDGKAFDTKTKEGSIYECYANVVNPLVVDATRTALKGKMNVDITYDRNTGRYDIKFTDQEGKTYNYTTYRLEEAFDAKTKAQIENYYKSHNNPKYRINGKNVDIKKPSPFWDIMYNGESMSTDTIAKIAREQGHDGVIIKNVVEGTSGFQEGTTDVIVFNSEQVKDVNNEHPTENEDIRYSLEVEDWDKLFSEMTEVKESNRILAEGLKSIDKVKLNDKITNKIASEIKSEYKSRIDKKVLAESLQRVFSYMLDTGSPSYGDLAEIMREVAMPIIEQATEVMAEEKRMYDTFKEKMKGYRIKLNSQQKAEVAKTFGSYYAFKNALFGNIVFSESGSELDSIWQSVVEASNGMLDIGTSDANQPMALYEFIQGLKPSYSNIYGADQEEAAYDVALSIFGKFLLEQEYENNPKLRQEALKLNEAHQKYRQTLKKNSDKRIKEEMAKIKMERDINIKRLIKEINQLNEDESNVIKGSIEQAFIVKQKQEYERRLQRLREYKNEQMDRKLAELRAKQKDSQTKRIQSRQITQAKAKIRKNIETLNSMLAHGTEKRHIPVNMVRATIEMLEAIDINTGNSKSLAAYLEKMDNIYKGLKGAEAYAFDYDERTQQTLAMLKKMFEGRNYTMLSLDELNQVVDITKQLVTQIQNANKLMFEQKRLDAIDFSKQAIKEVRNAKHIDNAFMNALDKYLTPHLNAYREFRKISGYTDGAIMQLYNDLDKGQLKQLQVMKDINELFDDVLKDTKEVKKFTSTDEKDLVDSGLKDEKGNPVMITKAQRMALIMSAYNDKNMEHITYGGVKIPDLTKKKREDALAKGKTYWYESPIEIRDAIYGEDTDKLNLIKERASMKVKALEKELSPWEQKFLEKVKEMFWHKTGSLINKTSLELKGYALARVNKYFPIISDKNFVNQDVGGLIQDGTLEGWGNLKERKFGRNAIVLEDITDTILRQTNDVAKYVGLVVPIRNLNVAWNTNVYDITTAKRDTLINAIDQAWGANNKKYIENLIKDMTSRRDGGDLTFLDALRGRFAGAVLTLNPSVAIKQSASYFTAGAIVGNKTLAKTVRDIGKGFITKKGISELEAINPLLWYRNQGNATQELADMKRTGFGKNLPTWAQKAINWVEFMDTGTIRTLEYAAKNYVDDHYIGKNKLEGKEYWEKVSEVFTKIVEETQPNYTPLQQADIIRNPNKALKLLVMFKTQPLQNMGVLYDSIGELRAKVKAEDQDGIKSAKKKVARAIVSQIQSAMTFSMMTILADLLLHKFYKYKDDDDEFSWEKVLSKFGAGITDSFWGMLLFGQDAYKAVDSFLNGEDVNGLNVSFLDNLANFANAIGKLVDESQKRMDAVTEEDRQKYDNGIILDTGNVLNYFGQIAGVPIGNLKNMAESLILYAMDVRDGKIGENDFSRDVDSQNERMYEALLADDSERYHKLFDEAVLKKTNKGTDQDKAEESVTSGIKKLIQKGYDSGQLTFDEAYTILTKEMGMDETDAYFKLDEWLYKSEGNDSYSRYSRMINAIDNALETDDRKGILEEIQKLKDNKVDVKNIQSMITKEFKPKYLELKAQNKSATIRSILISAYMATGLSRDDAEKRIDNWK